MSLNKDTYLQLLLIVPAVALAEPSGLDVLRGAERIVSIKGEDLWQ